MGRDLGKCERCCGENKNLRLWDLRQMEVINTCDCKRLGCVSDIIVHCETGCIEALIVPGPGRLCGFLGRDTEYVIPWKCVEQIGKDIILVNVDIEKIREKCEY